MYTPNGLHAWEIVTASGLFALAILGIATLIGVTLAWGVFRERVPAHRPVVTPNATPAVERPADHPADFAGATA